MMGAFSSNALVCFLGKVCVQGVIREEWEIKRKSRKQEETWEKQELENKGDG